MQVQKKTVLVLGATGYLGQFLTEDLAKTHKVGYLYSARSPCSSYCMQKQKLTSFAGWNRAPQHQGPKYPRRRAPLLG